MKAEEKLRLIDEILVFCYERGERKPGYRNGMMEAIDTILNFDKEEEEK